MYYLLLLVCGSVIARQHTGYPAGLMADCPGMKATTTLSEKTKDDIRIRVLRPSTSWFEKSEVTCSVDNAGADCVAHQVDLQKEEVAVFTSGYLDFSYSPITRSMARSYLDHGKIVIIVELFPILLKTYPIAARLTKPIGVFLGKFLVKLSERGLSPNRIQLLGGSLGAHIGAYAAMKYYDITGQKVSRLTGLDPAGPCFRNLDPKDRFNADAAVRVDALHTNIDGFGIADAIAQIDYYANGGEFQARLAAGFLLPCFELCSHLRSASYWMSALYNPDQFVALRCASVSDVRHANCYDSPIVTNVLGPQANFSRPGIYYLPTLEEDPYYMGEKGLVRRKYDINNYLLKVAKEDDLEI